MITTVEEAHLIILRRACEIANRRWADQGGRTRTRGYAPGERFNVEKRRARGQNFVQGEIFRPDPFASQSGGMAISIDPVVTAGLDEETIRGLHDIGRSAVKESLKENQKILVGLIIGEARQGRNYFSRFA